MESRRGGAAAASEPNVVGELARGEMGRSTGLRGEGEVDMVGELLEGSEAVLRLDLLPSWL